MSDEPRQLALVLEPAPARPGRVHYYVGRVTVSEAGEVHHHTSCGWCTGPEHADRRTRRRKDVTCRVCLRKLGTP